jgi:hypothetical protein
MFVVVFCRVALIFSTPCDLHFLYFLLLRDRLYILNIKVHVIFRPLANNFPTNDLRLKRRIALCIFRYLHPKERKFEKLCTCLVNVAPVNCGYDINLVMRNGVIIDIDMRLKKLEFTITSDSKSDSFIFSLITHYI